MNESLPAPAKSSWPDMDHPKARDFCPGRQLLVGVGLPLNWGWLTPFGLPQSHNPSPRGPNV